MTTKLPRTIRLIRFGEEPIGNGRKLLQCFFQDNQRNEYKWTPLWKGNTGVIALTEKAVHVEEWNEPDGPWTGELRKASEQVPEFKDLVLPVAVRVSNFHQRAGDEGYRVEIEISGTETWITGGHFPDILIGDCLVRFGELSQEFLARFGPAGYGIGSSLTRDTWPGRGSRIGGQISFEIFIPAIPDPSDYSHMGREIGTFVRSFIRRHLVEFKRTEASLKEGFEKLE